MGMIKNVQTQTIGEEIANSISHGVGAGLSVAALVLLIVKAVQNSGALGIVSACIYGGSLVLLYLLSCLYHALAKTKARRVFQILDHCSIFILIVGTYTPIALCFIGGVTGWVIFGVNSACMILGIVFNAINMEKAINGTLCNYGLAYSIFYKIFACISCYRSMAFGARRSIIYSGNYFLQE